MSNYIYIPKLNPISFRAAIYAAITQYQSKQFDDYRFEDMRLPWQQKTHYCQKIQQSDITYLQFISNFDPLPYEIINQYGNVAGSGNAVQKRQDKYNPGYYAYEIAINWASYAAGGYYISLPSISYFSEPLIISEKFENTLLFTYFHTGYHEDVIFPTGIKFSFRVEGNVGKLLPKNKDQLYEDQKENPYTLSSKPYSAFELNIGGTFGVPDWVIEKMNYIWSCNNVLIDGKPFGKSSETKFELVGEDHYPMRSINMEVMPGINRGSKIISPTVNTDQKIVVSYNIPGRIFGGLPDDGVIVITDFE